MAKIALIDDHRLLRTCVRSFLEASGHNVVIDVNNGQEFIQKLTCIEIPDIVLLDIHMPVMDGFETARWLKLNHSSVKILAVSMYEDEQIIWRIIKASASGYIQKQSEPSELIVAISAMLTHGYYYSDTTGRRSGFPRKLNMATPNVNVLKEQEINFLRLICSELTYKEIAMELNLSPRTIDGYREDLFEKLEVRSRVGLVLFAIKSGIYCF